MTGLTPAPVPWGQRARAAWRLVSGDPIGWRDPLFLAARPGAERALRFVAMLLLLQRLSYLLPAAADLVRLPVTNYRSVALNAALLVMAFGVNIALAVAVKRRGWFPVWLAGTDVLLVGVFLAVSVANCPPGVDPAVVDWPAKLGYAAVALAAAAFRPRWAVASGLLLFAVELAALAVRDGSAPHAEVAVDHLNSYLWWGVIIYFMRRYMVGQARTLDEVSAARLAAESRRVAERTLFAERLSHYRTLHDTALSTLTAIARGGLDHRTDEVRRRCAVDADVIRRLITDDTSGGFTDLGDRLATVLDHAAGIGLRAHYQHDPLPDEVPEPVIDAIAHATAEALNNVGRHAGTDTVWVTVTWDDGVLVVRVVDRGDGFDPARTALGFGRRWSIAARMTEVGGTAEVISAPGDGTCVTLTWPAG